MREMTRAMAVERSLVKRFRKQLWQPFIAAVKRYALLSEGDHAAAVLDGTSAALAAAMLLREVHRHSEFPFALTILAREEALPLAAELGIPVSVFSGDAEEAARSAGCSRLAGAGCMTDAVEAVFSSMFHEGTLRAFLPREPLGKGLTLIRPLYCCERRDLRAWCRYNALPWVPGPEEADPGRQQVRAMLDALLPAHPNAEISVFRALHAVHLDTFPPQAPEDGAGR